METLGKIAIGLFFGVIGAFIGSICAALLVSLLLYVHCDLTEMAAKIILLVCGGIGLVLGFLHGVFEIFGSHSGSAEPDDLNLYKPWY